VMRLFLNVEERARVFCAFHTIPPRYHSVTVSPSRRAKHRIRSFLEKHRKYVALGADSVKLNQCLLGQHRNPQIAAKRLPITTEQDRFTTDLDSKEPPVCRGYCCVVIDGDRPGAHS
jgi:hypothetical protein